MCVTLIWQAARTRKSQKQSEGLMIPNFLQSIVWVFFALALLIWTASAFVFTAPANIKWLLWGAGCAAIAFFAQLLVYLLINNTARDVRFGS